MSDWQKLTNAVIVDYVRNTEESLRKQGILLNRLCPNRKPYVAPHDTRTPEQKLADKQRQCDHDFMVRGKQSRRRLAKCRHCGLKVPRDFAKGYVAGHENGIEHERYHGSSGDEE